MSASFKETQKSELEGAQRVAVIREEFIALTKNPLIAVLLNQLVYWSRRTADFKAYIEEEQRGNKKESAESQHGWIYKTVDELTQETLIKVSAVTLRRYIAFLTRNGWLETRPNRKNKWDQTLQYRIKLAKLSSDLQSKGYTLSWFPNGESEAPSSQNTSNFRDEQNASIDVSKSCTSKRANFSSRSVKSYACNTETTTKTLNKEKAANVCSTASKSIQKNEERDSSSQLEFMEQALKIWKREFGQEVGPCPTLKKKLIGFLNSFCKGDLSRWKSLCLRASESSFLKGEGKRGWRMTLAWLLVPQNATKVLKGKYDDPGTLTDRQKQLERESFANQKTAFLETIVDPLWKDWCTRLAEGTSHEPSRVTLSELKTLAKASFHEFDERLVWICCPDMPTLRCVESYRLPLITIAQSRFPKARNIRTEIKKPSPPYQQKGISHG